MTTSHSPASYSASALRARLPNIEFIPAFLQRRPVHLLNLCGRLGMALADDALVPDKPRVAWRYLEVPGYA